MNTGAIHAALCAASAILLLLLLALCYQRRGALGAMLAAGRPADAPAPANQAGENANTLAQLMQSLSDTQRTQLRQVLQLQQQQCALQQLQLLQVEPGADQSAGESESRRESRSKSRSESQSESRSADRSESTCGCDTSPGPTTFSLEMAEPPPPARPAAWHTPASFVSHIHAEPAQVSSSSGASSMDPTYTRTVSGESPTLSMHAGRQELPRHKRAPARRGGGFDLPVVVA